MSDKQEKIEAMIEKFDKDKDKQISFNEFKEMISSIFTK